MSRVSVCQTCGSVIEYEGGVFGPPGWYDVALVDADNTGTTCPISGEPHLPRPAEVAS